MSLDETDILDIYAPTKNGTSELMGGSTQFSAKLLQLLVLFDGKLALSEIARLARGITAKEIAASIPALVKRGYIELVQPGKNVKVDFGGFFGSAGVQGYSAKGRGGSGQGDRNPPAKRLLRQYCPPGRTKKEPDERGQIFGPRDWLEVPMAISPNRSSTTS